VLLAIYFAVGALAIECLAGGDAANKCTPDKCESVGNAQICTDCQAGNVPINGVCADATASEANCKNKAGNGKADQTCEQCLNAYFMYKGGCYQTTQQPGQSMCAGASDGKCDTPADGKTYFVVPGATKTDQSVVACGDTTGVTVDTNKKYVGVDGCAKCDAPESLSAAGTATATCTECNANLYLKTVTEETSKTSCVAEAACKEEGTHFPTTDSSNGDKKVCASCGTAANGGIDNCGECSLLTPASRANSVLITCTKCENSKYLKSDGTCVDNCASDSTEFAKEDDVNGNRCVSCGDETDGITDCTTCSNAENTLKCSACNNDKKPNTTGTACVACNIANCANCNEENVCEACTNNKKLSPLKDACLDICPAGTYDSSNVCTPCHTSCAECNNSAEATSCTACYPGHVLNKTNSSTTSTCIPECTGRYAENCGANQCTANIGGSKYCSKCKSGFVPVDGLCVSVGTTRAAPNGCTPGIDGTCSACTDAYFKESGGCYLSTAYPGNTLCSQAANGQCSQCANGQQVDSNTGSCPACDSTCKTCTATNDPTKCSACFPGYYLDAGKACKKCSETSGDIQGVENCISCLAPTSPSTPTPVTCYVTQTPTVDPADPSVNKTGLSSGAIAGISVAVIVVVGGLVEFLCW
ncbi:Variant-specific surface protein, partial [Giardia duodenalis]